MLWLSVLFLCFLANSQAHTANEIYDNLSDEDKVHFLRYYIAKGYRDSRPTDSGIYPGITFPDDLPIPSDVVETFENMDIEPADFHVTLLKNFTNKYNLTPEEALQVARKRCNCVPKNKYICMPNGDCLPVGDVGGVCCT